MNPIPFVRNPDERFSDLDAWPFEPRWLDDLHVDLDDAGHFVQEVGDLVARRALEHFA